MNQLLDKIDQQPGWFTRRRFAVVSWPFLLTSGAAFIHPYAALALFMFAVLAASRLIYLLPIESRWIQQATAELEASKWDAAMSRLRQPPRWCGKTAWIKGQHLLATTYLEKGSTLAAWETLNCLDERDLLRAEKDELTFSRAWLYHEVGNIRDFLSCADSLSQRVGRADHRYVMLHGLAYQTRGEFDLARESLERALELARTPKAFQQLYNNLAVLAGLQGQRCEQANLLKMAMRYLRESPTASMLVVITSNLAFSLLHNKKLPEAARDVMREAWQLSDRSNKQQVQDIF